MNEINKNTVIPYKKKDLTTHELKKVSGMTIGEARKLLVNGMTEELTRHLEKRLFNL